MQRTGPPQVGLGLEPKRLSLPLKKRAGVVQTEGGGEECVVANLRVKVERQMNAVERQIIIKRKFERALPCASDGLQPRPKQAVMHHEKIDPLRHRQLHRSSRRVDGGANFRDRAGIFDLQAVERIWVVLDLREAQTGVGKTDYLIERRHGALC
jgi:hypothetical protein